MGELAGRSYPVLMTVEEMEAAAIALELHRLRRGGQPAKHESTASRWRAGEALERRLAKMASEAATLDPVTTDG